MKILPQYAKYQIIYKNTGEMVRISDEKGDLIKEHTLEGVECFLRGFNSNNINNQATYKIINKKL